MLSLLGSAAADFHLASSFILSWGTDYTDEALVYLPSNKYNCDWLKTAGYGKGDRVVDSTQWPSTFTSKVAICGERSLKFQQNSNQGFDLIQTNGENVGHCDRNFGGNGFKCNGVGYTYDLSEHYVCYSYLCKE
jgi:hypothetical protein